MALDFKKKKTIIWDELKRLRHMKKWSVYINKFWVKRVIVEKDKYWAYIVNWDDLMKALNKIQSSLINLYAIWKHLKECECLTTKKNKLILTFWKEMYRIEVQYYTNDQLLHLIDENGRR